MPKTVYRNDFRKLSYVAFGLITLSVLAIALTGLRRWESRTREPLLL